MTDPEAQAANRRYLAAQATALRAALAAAEAEVLRLSREVVEVERELRLAGGAIRGA